jgi:hypothetical protein
MAASNFDHSVLGVSVFWITTGKRHPNTTLDFMQCLVRFGT